MHAAKKHIQHNRRSLTLCITPAHSGAAIQFSRALCQLGRLALEQTPPPHRRWTIQPVKEATGNRGILMLRAPPTSATTRSTWRTIAIASTRTCSELGCDNSYECIQPGTVVTVTLQQSNLEIGVHGYEAYVYFYPEVLEFVAGEYDHYDCWDPQRLPDRSTT